MADPIIPRLLREHAPKLVGKALESQRLDPETGKPKKQPLAHKIAQGLMLRIATKSVPGAIVVGGIMLAKHLNDRRKAKVAEEK
jgi:hypothetical protein